MTSNQSPYSDPKWPTQTQNQDGTGMPDTTADPTGIGYAAGSGYPTGTGYSTGTGEDTFTPGQQSTKEAAAGQAADVKDHAVEAGRDVTQTAKSEAASVAGDVTSEIRGLFDTSMSEVRTQAGAGQSRLATGLHSLAGELGDLAQGRSTEQGTATRAVQELASYGDNVASWLENREPADVLDEVRRFAARRPVAFLAIAAGAGLLAGRFARGLQADRAEPDTLNPGYRTQPVQDYHQPRFGGTSTDPVWNQAATVNTEHSGDPLYAPQPGAAADPTYPTGDSRGFSSQYGTGQYGNPGVQR